MSRTAQLIAEHEAAGRYFHADGVRSFVREQGDGQAVVLVHGVPSNCFLYRKVIPPLAAEGLRAVAFDFPGMGLAERPESFDYSWSGLSRWIDSALPALGIEQAHLVVHDVGGPIGFDWAIRNAEKVQSLTVLNTLSDLDTFRRPWPMHPFSIRGVGEVWLRSLNAFAFSELFYMQGVADRSATPRDEVYVYYDLLRKRGDRGRAFLKIMRGFELTAEKQHFFEEGLSERPYPAQIVWGERDPALGEDRRLGIQRMLGIDDPIMLPAKHFLQEDQAPAVAAAVAALALRTAAG
jgi:pimeloyl-ACP methyl ester carboxylesterase